ncbi:hypothetical protein KI809_12355 [Geobacter pelophilus]|uniref:Uncharacterized protein n=1 Tax=Geoanaerobacter pelophilus TaxID=60036 RepID=A0AAW4L6D1_9BACT|nr:hypothetical protein [Geoanaerobacter pelophilus]MBT0665090.1 hypothetical protein [Geoanaerobacter pelophilus]
MSSPKYAKGSGRTSSGCNLTLVNDAKVAPSSAGYTSDVIVLIQLSNGHDLPS